ncbi:uncharacterized protein [Littorina saxatilis]|uniref:RBR-type E3 ubiquitin transferase n=1 Tax=Littorina saxatilis TaxID=31220 RepID=A0AAN9GCZ2_9CAEN
MVHKTSHRGVHSGNTLRAFKSRYSRRYQNQSCIVSRVRPELLKKLVGGDADDKVPADDKRTAQLNNVAVDVALSLNKQSRWLLPSALIRQIQSNDVAQSDLTVSLLERHKLKRPSSCVSFHSNKGEVKRIQPRNGRYFSFNFPTADGKSRRAYRREKREELIEQLRANTAGKTEKIVGKQIEVFTELGRAARNPEIGESEVRYEVYYPSPAQSSLSHNPKYIKQDVSVAPGDNNEHVQHGKPKKQHRGKQRKRMSVKDLDDCDLPSYHAHYQHDLVPVTDSQEIAQVGDSQEIAQVGDSQEIAQAADGSVQHKITDCLLGSLIEKAERLQQMVGVAKTRRRKKSGSKTSSHHQEDKSHIVYLSEAQQADDSEAEASLSAASTALPVAVTPLESTRVLLPTEDVTVTSLKDSFGQNYFEAACRPRKFLLDITTNVKELLKKRGVQPKVADITDDALTYLIFIHDGFYDDEHDVYKVLLNSRLREGLLSVQVNTDDGQDLYKGTVINLVSCAVDFAEGFVAELQGRNHFPSFCDRDETKGEQRELKHHLGSAEIYVPSLQRIFQMGSSLTDFSLPSLSDMLQEEPVFCDVCYDDVSPLTQDSASATTLLKCKHRVCDSCWSQHIHSRLHQGFVRVTCPGYDCQDEVKVGVLLSVVPLGTVEKVLKRQDEIRIGASVTEKWCPNQSCGRVLHLQAATAAGHNSQLQAATASGPNSQLQAATSSDPNFQLQAATASDPNSQLQAATASDPNSQLQAATASDPNSTLQAATASDPNSQLQQDVVCTCGSHVCFQCLSPAHWPASCAQAEDYRHKLATTVFPDREAEVHDDHNIALEAKQKRELEEQKVMLVEGKYCPRCRNFVYKNGGCPQMTCNCGQNFCWFCGKAGYSHPYRGKGCVDEHAEKKLTTTIIVRHLQLATDEKKEERQKAAAVQRQRVSLMERAAEHRQRRLNAQHGKVVTSMAKAVATAAAKDTTLAQHIVNVCSNTFPSSAPEPSALTSSAVKTPKVMDVVTTFLKRAARSKQELYEVAEYSLVLLKDLPDSLHRRRALRISEDLGAFCTFAQSIFEAWGASHSGQGQEGVKAVMRLAEIQGWINSALASHVATVRKLRSSGLDKQ